MKLYRCQECGEGLVKFQMIDIDGTNLEEGYGCSYCGYEFLENDNALNDMDTIEEEMYGIVLDAGAGKVFKILDIREDGVSIRTDKGVEYIDHDTAFDGVKYFRSIHQNTIYGEFLSDQEECIRHDIKSKMINAYVDESRAEDLSWEIVEDIISIIKDAML